MICRLVSLLFRLLLHSFIPFFLLLLGIITWIFGISLFSWDLWRTYWLESIWSHLLHCISRGFEFLLRFTSTSSSSVLFIVSKFGHFNITFRVIGLASYLILTFSFVSSSWYIWTFSAIQSHLKWPFWSYLKYFCFPLLFLIILLF